MDELVDPTPSRPDVDEGAGAVDDDGGAIDEGCEEGSMLTPPTPADVVVDEGLGGDMDPNSI